MRVALLFDGYATGVFSSRKLAQALHYSRRRLIPRSRSAISAPTPNPDHRIIVDFHERFLEELVALFTEVLLIAQAMGLVIKLDTVSLDAIKLKDKCQQAQGAKLRARQPHGGAAYGRVRGADAPGRAGRQRVAA
jgi:hypothetical protein